MPGFIKLLLSAKSVFVCVCVCVCVCMCVCAFMCMYVCIRTETKPSNISNVRRLSNLQRIKLSFGPVMHS